MHPPEPPDGPRPRPLLRDRYELRDLLGEGGQGTVMRAWDHLHERTVAVKIRPAGSDVARKELLVEARTLLGLRPHAGLPLVREDFFDGDRYVIVMDYVEGAALDCVLADHGDPGLAPSAVLGWLEQVAGALDHLHSHDPPVVHGDVKPANLVLARDGRVVLVDLGLAGGEGGGGSPGYLAPEVAAGSLATAAADVYGLAATAVALLSGSPPAGDLPTWEGIPPALAGSLERGLRRALSTDPRRRPSSAGGLVERLRAFLRADLPSGLVTFWCTAVPGSAGRWEHQPEAMAAALPRYHRLLAEAAEANGGHLVSTQGEDDGTMSVFAAAGDALRAAVDARGALRREVWPAALSFPVGMVLHSGEAEARQGGYHGPAVNRALRLRALAGGDQILLSAAAAGLVSDALAPGASLASLGERVLPGLDRPESVFVLEMFTPIASPRPPPPGGRFSAVAARADRLPLPVRLETTATGGFVGRAVELEAIAAAWAAAAAGARRVVFLAGEPGMGKTRLVTEAARAAHDGGARVLYGHCDEDHDVPYQPFTEAIRGYVSACSDDELGALAAAHAAELARLVPELGRRLPDLPALAVASPETERYRLFDAVAALLAEAARRAPVFLVLEDLHWAGKPALLLLRHLVASTELAGLLAVGTYRENELGRQHPLTGVLADLRREAGVTRLGLTGLSEPETATLAEMVLEEGTGRTLNGSGAGLVRAVWGETEGNPFFVVEMLRHLTESGAVAPGDRPAGRGGPAGPAALGVPDSVREVIGHRVARQPATVGSTLGAAAVIGREFDLTLLRGVVDLSEDEMFDALDQAAAATLVGEMPGLPGRFTFAHALVRHTLYEELGTTQRKRLHRRVAEALERGGGGRVEELAHHWFEAWPVAEPAPVVAACRRSGDAALERLAYEEAAVLYERALAVLERQGEHRTLEGAELLVRLGDAQRRSGDAGYRVTMTAAAGLARDLVAPELLAQATLGSSRPGSWYMGIGDLDEPLVALYEEAITTLGGADGVLRARLLAQLAVELYWTSDRPRRVALSDAAVAVARRVGDGATLAQVLLARFIALSGPELTEETFSLTAELATLAAGLGDLETAFLSRLIRGIALVEMADWDAALAQLEAAVGLAAQLRQPFYAWLVGTVRAMLALLAGPTPGVEGEVAEMFILGQQCGDVGAAHAFGAQQSLVRWDAGRIDEMTGAIGAFAEATPRIPGWKAVLIAAHVEGGRLDEAREMFEVLAADGFDLPVDWVWTVATALLGESCAFLGDVERARVLYRRLLPSAERLVICANGICCLGAMSRVLGHLAATMGDWEAAERHFEHAVELNGRIGANSFLVRTQRAYAAMLLDRAAPGDGERAAALVAASSALAGELGMALEIERLSVLAQRASA